VTGRTLREAESDLPGSLESVVSIWPYFVRTERLMRINRETPDEWDHDVAGAESQRFVGRPIVALANAEDQRRYASEIPRMKAMYARGKSHREVRSRAAARSGFVSRSLTTGMLCSALSAINTKEATIRRSIRVR